MPVNKVVYEAKVLLDLTEDTVTEDTMLSGIRAHDKTGAIITGNIVVQKCHIVNEKPDASLGNEGDLFLVRKA